MAMEVKTVFEFQKDLDEQSATITAKIKGLTPDQGKAICESISFRKDIKLCDWANHTFRIEQIGYSIGNGGIAITIHYSGYHRYHETFKKTIEADLQSKEAVIKAVLEVFENE